MASTGQWAGAEPSPAWQAVRSSAARRSRRQPTARDALGCRLVLRRPATGSPTADPPTINGPRRMASSGRVAPPWRVGPAPGHHKLPSTRPAARPPARRRGPGARRARPRPTRCGPTAGRTAESRAIGRSAPVAGPRPVWPVAPRLGSPGGALASDSADREQPLPATSSLAECRRRRPIAGGSTGPGQRTTSRAQRGSRPTRRRRRMALARSGGAAPTVHGQAGSHPPAGPSGGAGRVIRPGHTNLTHRVDRPRRASGRCRATNGLGYSGA